MDKIMFNKNQLITSKDIMTIKTNFTYNKKGELIGYEIKEVEVNNKPVCFKKVNRGGLRNK